MEWQQRAALCALVCQAWLQHGGERSPHDKRSCCRWLMNYTAAARLHWQQHAYFCLHCNCLLFRFSLVECRFSFTDCWNFTQISFEPLFIAIYSGLWLQLHCLSCIVESLMSRIMFMPFLTIDAHPCGHKVVWYMPILLVSSALVVDFNMHTVTPQMAV